MSIQAINNVQTKTANPPKKTRFTDNFQTRIKNSADLNDCIAVPRTIFKGYLGIMFGTMIASGANLVKKAPVLKTIMNAVAIGLSAYGTWAFARPYAVKDAVPTIKPKSTP